MGKKKGSKPPEASGTGKNRTPKEQDTGQQQKGPQQGAQGIAPQGGPQQSAQGTGPQGGPQQSAQGIAPQRGPQQSAQGTGPQGGPQQSAWSRGPPRGPQQGAQDTGPQGGPQQSAQGIAPQRGPQQGAQGTGPQGGPQRQDAARHKPHPQQQSASDGRLEPRQKEQVQQQQQIGSQDSQTKDEKAKGRERTPKPEGDKKSPESVSSFQFTPRIYAPKKSGKPITVATNFFPLVIGNTDIVVCHYDVTIEPDKPKYLLRPVWNKYVSLMFPGRLTAFDGKNAYSRGPLTDAETADTTVTVFNEETNKEKEFKVSIKEVRRISFACFKDYRARMLQDSSLKILPEAEISVLDIILRNWACDNFVRSNRTFFPVSAKSPLTKDLSNKLCVRFGYFQSAFLGYFPYLNFDISFKAFYKEGPILNILECFRQRHSKLLDVDGMNHFIKSVKVEYQLPNNASSRKIFRVNKLVDSANNQTFKKEDGKTMTVAEYFAKEKKIKLQYPDLPLLWVGPNQKSIYVPMEFCKILPNQVYRGFVDPYETREMVRTATSNARDRQRDVYSAFADTNINSHPLMKEFELKVSGEMEKVAARVLDAPGLKTSRNVTVSEGVWRIRDFLQPVVLQKWCIVIVDKQISKQNVMNLQRLLRDKGNQFNMTIAEAAKNPIEAEPSQVGLKKAFSQLKGMEMVFVIISEAKGLYGKVKAICETQEGILTQCIKSRTVSQEPRKLSTTVENILLKVNAKLGGKNHSLDSASIPPCLNGYVMVVGADVTHSSPGMSIPSVAAVTVSCDPAAFQYGTTTRVQPKGEMIKDLEEIMSIHVKKFFQLRKKYPEKIIFFRDGVSEGEMGKVLTGELTAVQRACSPYCQPKITFVVVQKRHHTRFYPTDPRDAQGKNFNVPVGTCVDTDIVHPRELDFYLVSHASILGTARPTRYRLLHDDNKLTDNELETLSYYLCHLFARCNRSVSYPSPTYNAHLAAARVRAYLEGLNMMGCNDVSYIQNKIPDCISEISPMFFV